MAQDAREVSPDLKALLKKSTSPFVAELVQTQSASDTHEAQLTSLFARLSSSRLEVAMCLQPGSEKAHAKALGLDQLVRRLSEHRRRDKSNNTSTEEKDGGSANASAEEEDEPTAEELMQSGQVGRSTEPGAAGWSSSSSSFSSGTTEDLSAEEYALQESQPRFVKPAITIQRVVRGFLARQRIKYAFFLFPPVSFQYLFSNKMPFRISFPIPILELIICLRRVKIEVLPFLREQYLNYLARQELEQLKRATVPRSTSVAHSQVLALLLWTSLSFHSD